MFETFGEVVILIIMTLIGAAVGFGIGRATARPSDSRAADDLASVRAQLASSQATCDQLGKQLEYTQGEVTQMRAQETERLRAEQLKAQRGQSDALDAQEARKNGEAALLEAFAPVQKNLDELGRRVAAMEQSRKQEMGALGASLQALGRQQQSLGKQTESLAAALRNNKVRGAWGEAQLKNIVESAGLLQHVDFDTQVVLEDSGRRPDMVVHMPGGKCIPIDAKTPYSDYQRACDIPDSADETQLRLKAQLLAGHAKAVRAHVDELARREYWASPTLGDTPDFVIAFVPNESVLQAALEQDSGLMDYAFSKKVALCSPVTLWAVLKSVSYAWQQQGLTDDAQELFTLSRELYDRMATLGDRAAKLGGSITQTVKNYNAFVGTLEGRVLPTARKLQKIEIGKVIPEASQLDPEKTDVRELTAAEFADVRPGMPPRPTMASGGASGGGAGGTMAGTVPRLG